MTELDQMLSDMGRQLRGVWALAVADNDGILISSWESPDNKLSPEFLAGQFITVMRNLISSFAQTIVQESLGTPAGIIEDVVLTTPFSYLMVRPICKGSCYLLIDSSKEVPLGMLRLAATNLVPKLEKSLPA